MPTVIDHIIQGSIVDGDKIDFAKEHLAVHAFVKGQEVAQADVDTSGRYKLTFKSGEERPTTELRVTGSKAGESGANLALADILIPTQFVTEGTQAIAQRNLTLPGQTPSSTFPVQCILPIFGQVFARIGNRIELQPGLKLDFYTFQPGYELRPGMKMFIIVTNKVHCCSSFTAPDGSYTGHFTYRVLPPQGAHFMVDISQFVNGNWNKVYSENINLPIFQLGSHYDFLLPGDKLVPKPVFSAPDTGFRFGTIGIIPCDDAHFVKGYVSSQTGDPIQDLTHRPLRGVLRIFGLFAPGSQAAYYKFEIAETDESHLPGLDANLNWEELTDPLTNHEWDPVTRHWLPQIMGPDPILHLYKNIDGEPEFDWNEHALKFEWNSANKADGFYALRITAFDQNKAPLKINGETLRQEVPVLRIDNSLPVVKIEAVGAEQCGKVVSTDGKLNFNITAYDPQGDVLQWYIRALAGRDAIELNVDPTAVQFNPPANTGAPGEGVDSTPETVTIVNLPLNLKGCDPLVYNFELIAIGSAVTGYPGSEVWVRDDVSLMVTKS